MPVRDRLHALPRRAWILAGVLAALILVLIVAAARGGGDDSVRSASPASTVAAPGEPAVASLPAPTSSATSSTAVPRATTTTLAVTEPIDLTERYELDVDEDDPAIVARPIPSEPSDSTPPSTLAPPPWAASTRITEGGYVGVDVGCADDLSAQALDRFFAARVGPVLGWDYQHVYPLGGERYLWLFQDTFLDHTGVVSTLGSARFVHNAALLQAGRCFTLLHTGTTAKPQPFEPGNGGGVRSKWYWPMGGELADGQLWVFWVEMVKDPYDPDPPDGLGWHPNALYLAAYDQNTLKQVYFAAAADPGVTPIYGYAVSSDNSYSYLFGNTFEQNMVREGGFWNGPHSATQMWLARVPRGRLTARPEYRTADGWSPSRADAVPFSTRFYAENPMQPRYLDQQWVAATKVDGYWGEAVAIDVAPDPWGPWTTVEYFGLQNRGNDPKKNTYHAHLLPWRDRFGSVLVTASNNARNMLRDAWPRPDRYRPMVFFVPYYPTPAPTTSTTSTTTVAPSTTTSTTPPSTTSTTTSTTSTTVASSTTTSTTTSTTPPSTTTSTTTPSTTIVPTTTILATTTTVTS